MPGYFDAEPDRIRSIYQRTELKRTPITGIVTGYHTLPFTLVGPNDESDAASGNPGSLKLTGKISVSPKLVISVSPQDERFAEIFQENEPFMDRTLVSRVFSFSAGYRKNLRIRNEHLTVESFPDPDAELMEKVMNELARAEVINTGVIWCPEPRYYPVSLERFIVAVLEREFK